MLVQITFTRNELGNRGTEGTRTSFSRSRASHPIIAFAFGNNTTWSSMLHVSLVNEKRVWDIFLGFNPELQRARRGITRLPFRRMISPSRTHETMVQMQCSGRQDSLQSKTNSLRVETGRTSSVESMGSEPASRGKFSLEKLFPSRFRHRRLF